MIKIKKNQFENDDIDCNININKILDSNKNNNNNNINKNSKNNAMRHKTFHKKNSITYSTNQYISVQSEEKPYNYNLLSDKKTKELKCAQKINDQSTNKTTGDTGKTNEKCTIQLKSLKDQWYYQKILSDYNFRFYK